MEDRTILSDIEELVNQEHELMKKAEHGGLDEEERAQLQAIQVHLDQCWDLLRQRRARREFGQNPDEARTRDPKVVERYLQ